ncbi:MAG TPA: circularly permuted type 2 ATP-grasp protein [Blastocatellia bacterium]|nr:circularly permuted type 2 ATP-grasp protein [Blastocatellia bacterium]
MIRDAVRRYTELLASPQGRLTETRDILLNGMREADLDFGGRVLSPYLRPHFVDSDQWQMVTGVCEGIWDCIRIVGNAVQTDSQMMDDLRLTEGERKLISVDPGFKEISATSRLDSFLSDDSYQFVELNAECPAGIAYADVVSEIHLTTPVMKDFAEAYDVRPLLSRDKMLEVLLRCYQEFAGNNAPKPLIAIVDWNDVPTQAEFRLFQRYFTSQGYETIIADPRELEFTNGKLRHNGKVIDVVYRRLLTNEFLEKLDETRALLDAYQASAVCVVNSFRSKYVHKKMLFGILTDERYARYFSEAQQNLIKAHVPWTRGVVERRTKYYGEDVDLCDLIRRNRDNLVLKPNDEYGGKGIFIGWESDDAKWDEAIQIALQGDYLVQERVQTGHEEFPYFDSQGNISFVEQLVDLDPLLYFGKVGGAFTRLSTSSLANVTSGAGMTPTFLIAGKH